MDMFALGCEEVIHNEDFHWEPVAANPNKPHLVRGPFSDPHGLHSESSEADNNSNSDAPQTAVPISAQVEGLAEDSPPCYILPHPHEVYVDM